MTIASWDACGAGSSPMVLTSRPVQAEDEGQHGSLSPQGGGVGGAGGQEKAGNCARSGGLCQELELSPPSGRRRAKRGLDDLEPTWSVRKRRSPVAAAAACGSPSAAVDANRAAAATPCPRIEEVVKGGAGEKKPRVLFTVRGHRSPGGSAGEAEDVRKEEKIRPCKFPIDVQAPDDPAILGLSFPHVTVSDGGIAAVDQVNRAAHSMPFPRIQEPLNLSSGDNGNKKDSPLRKISIHKKQAAAADHKFKNHNIQESESAQSNITNQSDCKTYIVGSKDSYLIGLSNRLQCLGVTNVTPILAKTVTHSDCDFSQTRLLLSRFAVMDSPLLGMLTPVEHDFMYSMDGLPLEALDRHGNSYDITMKHLNCNKGYRIIGQWSKFLTQNRLCKDDLVKLGAFRFEGQLVLTLLHYGKAHTGNNESTLIETEANKEESASRETVEEECISRDMEARKEELTSRETVKEECISRDMVTSKEELASRETVEEECISRDMEACKEECVDSVKEVSMEEWTCSEIEAMEALLMLSLSEDKTKSQ